MTDAPQLDALSINRVILFQYSTISQIKYVIQLISRNWNLQELKLDT